MSALLMIMGPFNQTVVRGMQKALISNMIVKFLMRWNEIFFKSGQKVNLAHVWCEPVGDQTKDLLSLFIFTNSSTEARRLPGIGNLKIST